MSLTWIGDIIFLSDGSESDTFTRLYAKAEKTKKVIALKLFGRGGKRPGFSGKNRQREKGKKDGRIFVNSGGRVEIMKEIRSSGREKHPGTEERARQYFSHDFALYVDMSECVSRGAAEIFYAAEDGVFLCERVSGIHMLAADSSETARRLLEAFSMRFPDPKRKFLVAHGDAVLRAAYDCLPVCAETSCYQVVYTGGRRTLAGALRFARPEEAELETIKREYSLESPKNLDRLAAAGNIWCGFARENGKDTFVGFIGKHPEGSMGLLQVFPEYRRRGYGEELESFMINRFLDEGRIPYAHIIDDNRKSMNLQKKLGYDVANEKIYWLALR